MNKQARQLVEHISDQYVLLAADPAQAFAAAAQKKKKNRAKVFAIAAAAAAMYIIITVSLIIGALTPPDTPVAPPDDGPGTQDPDDYFQDGPEVQLPESGTFVRYLKNYWLPTWTTVDDPDSLAQSTSPYTVYNFQPDGRVHIIDVNGTSSTGKIGKYSFSDNTIEIWTKGQDGWKKSDLTITLQINETYYNTTMTVTEGEKSTVYIRPECTDEHVEFWNIDDERPVESTDNYYIESIMLSGMSSPISFEVPGLEYFKQLNVFHFSAPPALQTAHINSVSYKIYNEAFKLVAEGSSRMDAHSLSSCALKFPDEPGLYYIDVATSSHEASDIFQQLITHFYAAIQIGEEKVDEPVTPPTYPEPEINLPDIQTHATILSGRWISDDYDPHRYCLVFHQDGRVYIMDLSNKTSETGRYSWEEDHIDIWTFTENVGWELSNISVTKTEPLFEVTTPEGSSFYKRFTRASPRIVLRTGDNAYNSTQYTLHTFYYERLECGDSIYEFELPDFEIFEQLEPLVFDEAPTFYGNLGKSNGHYAVYDEEFNLIYEEDYILLRSDRPNSEPPIQIPDEDGIYYLDITYDLIDNFSEGFSRYLMHFYAAIQIGEGSEDGEGNEPNGYKPPVSTESPILIESCDTKPNGAFTLDTTNPVEGEGCWSITTPAAGALAFHAWENGIDASGCDVIEFDLYISDLGALEAMKRMCALELSSSETCDIQEIAFSGEQIVEFGRYGQEWQVGWNHVVLRLADATATNGPGSGSGKEAASFDISNVNFVRFYLLSATTSHTIKIDNICLSVEQK